MQTILLQPAIPAVPVVARSHNVTPSPDGLTHLDVLCGRQSFVLRHEGNRNYSKVVQSHAAQYKACKTKKDKAEITALVIEQIYQEGGRFLKMTDDGTWNELDKQSIHEKVQHALRSSKLKSTSGRAKPTRGTARAVIVEPSREEDIFFKEILSMQQSMYTELLASSRGSSKALQKQDTLSVISDSSHSELVQVL